MLGTQRVLQQAGGGGKGMVGGHRRHDDQLQSRRVQVGRIEGAAGRLQAQRECGFPVAGDAPLDDAGPLPDPLVRGIDHRRQVVVSHHPLGHRLAPPDDVGAAWVLTFSQLFLRLSRILLVEHRADEKGVESGTTCAPAQCWMMRANDGGFPGDLTWVKGSDILSKQS